MNKDLIVKKNNKGRGLYAGRDMQAGEVLEVAPMIVYPTQNVDPHTQRYVWHHGKRKYALPLGRMSLCNHSKRPNAGVKIDERNGTATLHTLKRVLAGTELFIDYGDEITFEVLK